MHATTGVTVRWALTLVELTCTPTLSSADSVSMSPCFAAKHIFSMRAASSKPPPLVEAPPSPSRFESSGTSGIRDGMQTGLLAELRDTVSTPPMRKFAHGPKQPSSKTPSLGK